MTDFKEIQALDTLTGEIINFKKVLVRDTNVSRTAAKVRAYVKYCFFEYGSCRLWTIGSNMEDLEAFADLVERFVHDYEGEEKIHMYSGEKVSTGRKYRIRDYIYCLEKGKKGGRCHIHMVTGQYIEWEDIKKKWSELHGIECHVKYESIHHNGMERIGWYVGKYMSKEKRVPGMRMLRSSAGLSKKISEFYDEKKELPLYVLKSKEYSRESDYVRPEEWQCPSV